MGGAEDGGGFTALRLVTGNPGEFGVSGRLTLGVERNQAGPGDATADLPAGQALGGESPAWLALPARLQT